jgi:sporulation protein YlmC with PRC-barrel domain
MAARKYSIAQQLIGRIVVTNKGEDIGRLNDIVIDETSGVIESLLVNTSRDSKLIQSLPRSGSLITIPYKSVFAISQMIVVDENLLV